MGRSFLQRIGVCAAAAIALTAGFQLASAHLPGAVVHAQDSADASPVIGPPGFAMAETAADQSGATAPTALAEPINASYTHTPAPNAAQDLPAGSGNIMPSTVIYYDFWLPTGQTYEGTNAGNTNYENLLTRWAGDVGASQYHNLVTQYNGKNGTISNTVSFGGQWVDTGTAYPHAGTTADPLNDGDIQTEVHNAVTTNGWIEDANHIVAVFTATGIQECMGGSCTFSATGGFCAYHTHFSDSGTDTLYAFMSFDNFTHLAGKTCVAGQTGSDTDPNRFNYPNNDASADAEINTLSHEIIEAETDPHPNDTWTGPNGEIGDACNFNFSPRNDIGADVYLNGNPYIVQQEWSNAVHTCAIDLPTNGFCSGSVSNVCSPATAFSKAVDNSTPRVTSTVHYTLTLNNTSDSGAETNLSLTDSPPAGYTVTALSAPSSTTNSFSPTSVTVAYDTLPVHQSRTVTVTATVPLQAGIPATNCGSLAGSDLLGTALSTQTSSPCATTTPVKNPTILTYNGATSSDFADTVTLSATLTDDAFNPISGKSIDFSLNGTETCSGTTDLSGFASCPITPGEAAGSYTVTAAFSDASDPKYSTSSTSATYTVLHEESAITSTSSVQLIQNGGTATLTAVLTDPNGGAPIGGKPVTITLGSGAGSQSCFAITTPAGVATCSISPVTVAPGPQTITDSFAGDGFYVPASNTQTALVFAFPVGGDFVVGDQTATGSVVFWGAHWASDNAFSGGSAPRAFKGFENSIPTPACGSATWMARGGNSSDPPAAVPSYMGVIVASTATKHGSTISGNIVHIVIVKTDPGYESNPGHPGTGTVVAQVC